MPRERLNDFNDNSKSFKVAFLAEQTVENLNEVT